MPSRSSAAAAFGDEHVDDRLLERRGEVRARALVERRPARERA